MNGITGILRPNGQFISCDYGNHCKITTEIPKKEEDLCIYFSSSIKDNGNDKSSVIYFDENITRKQLFWIVNNIKSMDARQYKMWLNYILGRGEK